MIILPFYVDTVICIVKIIFKLYITFTHTVNENFVHLKMVFIDSIVKVIDP